MISVALQTDVSIASPVEFDEEQTESPQAELNEEEGTTKHCLSNNALSLLQRYQLEPTWTREFLQERQAAAPSLKMILQFKETTAVRPKW